MVGGGGGGQWVVVVVAGRLLAELKDELSTSQATGQMANTRVYAFIFQKMPFLGG